MRSPGSAARCCCCRPAISARFTSPTTATPRTRRAIRSWRCPSPPRLAATSGRSQACPIGASGLPTTLRHALGRAGEPFIAPHARPRIVREARLLLGVYAAARARLDRRRQRGAALSSGWCPRCSASRCCACTCSPSTPAVPGPGDARELADHPQHSAGPAARLEHALPRRASRPPGAAVPRAAGGAPAARGADRGPGRRATSRSSARS